MKRRKLKNWVLPTLGIFVLLGSVYTYYLIGGLINYSVTEDQSYVTDALMDNTINVNEEQTITTIKPYVSEEVTVSKGYYRSSDEEQTQQKSLIKYESIYMPNTGILYSSPNSFDVVAVLDGKVNSVKEDEILGFIVEIEHSNQIITVYQSLSNVSVKEGDTVSQGDIIATSGSNKLDNEAENCLHFEVYKDGNLINPEDFYNMEISE